ncbi:hypothetical protein TWF694_000993 [Orbilia ellipsospora]|uniref:Essential protein Yae1 N-terminal domain-containing protein n=1 Tax=Orbilia ellipsospora TaxID=2528407 RepID=A0AAV9XWX3_9PEZI
MSSTGAGGSIRAKLGKESHHLSSRTDREFSDEYKLHCVPKSASKHVQPKPPPKAINEGRSQQTARTFPPTTETSASKQFKRTLDNFEKQQKLKGSTAALLQPKLGQTVKESSTKSHRPAPPCEESEGLLTLYEEAPIKSEDNLALNLDHHDNSRANLVRLCKIAYEKGRKDGIADDRKRVKEEGYWQGFKEGQKEGREDGWREGYRDGYDEGYLKGREYGDKKIEKEINETIAELTKNPNALLMSPPTHSPSDCKDILTMI